MRLVVLDLSLHPVSGKPHAERTSEHLYIRILSGGNLGGWKSVGLRSDTSHKTAGQSVSRDNIRFADNPGVDHFGERYAGTLQ